MRSLRAKACLIVAGAAWAAIFVACGSGTTQTAQQVASSVQPPAESDLSSKARARGVEVIREARSSPDDATEVKRMNDRAFAVTGTVDGSDWRVVLAVNQAEEFLPMYVSIGDEELPAASDEELRIFYGDPSEAEIDAEAQRRFPSNE